MAATVAELAWLAGIIEADGSVGMGFHRAKKGFACTPTMTVCNQDLAIIEKVRELWLDIGGNSGSARLINTGYGNGRESVSVSLKKQDSLMSVLVAIFPYMVGQKGKRAKLVLEFLESRINRRKEFSHGNTPYNRRELELAKTFASETRRKGGKRSEETVLQISERLAAIH